MKRKVFYLLQALLFFGSFLLYAITWTDYYFWAFISIVGMVLQALAAAWFVQTFRNRNTLRKTQLKIFLATVLFVSLVAAFCFLPSFWTGRLQAASILDGDMALVAMGREECKREKDASKRANILVWMTTHINPLGAHTTEVLFDLITSSNCHAEYLEKEKALASAKSTSESERDVLAFYIRECGKLNDFCKPRSSEQH